jgi:hypothetical protein
VPSHDFLETPGGSSEGLLTNGENVESRVYNALSLSCTIIRMLQMDYDVGGVCVLAAPQPK